MIRVERLIFSDPKVLIEDFSLNIQGSVSAASNIRQNRQLQQLEKVDDDTVAESRVLQLYAFAPQVTIGLGRTYLTDGEDTKKIEDSWELRTAIAKEFNDALMPLLTNEVEEMQAVLPGRLWRKRHRIVELFSHESLLLPRLALTTKKLPDTIAPGGFRYIIDADYHISLSFIVHAGESTIARIPGLGVFNEIIASLQESIDTLQDMGEESNAAEVENILGEVELRAAMIQLEEAGHVDLAERLATVAYGHNPHVKYNAD